MVLAQAGALANALAKAQVQSMSMNPLLSANSEVQKVELVVKVVDAAVKAVKALLAVEMKLAELAVEVKMELAGQRGLTRLAALARPVVTMVTMLVMLASLVLTKMKLAKLELAVLVLVLVLPIALVLLMVLVLLKVLEAKAQWEEEIKEEREWRYQYLKAAGRGLSLAGIVLDAVQAWQQALAWEQAWMWALALEQALAHTKAEVDMVTYGEVLADSNLMDIIYSIKPKCHHRLAGYLWCHSEHWWLIQIIAPITHLPQELLHLVFLFIIEDAIHSPFVLM